MENEDVKKTGMQIKNAATYNHYAHNLLSEVVNKSQGNKDVLMMIIPDIIICAFTCELLNFPTNKVGAGA